MKSIFIFGGKGFVGSNKCDSLLGNINVFDPLGSLVMVVKNPKKTIN